RPERGEAARDHATRESRAARRIPERVQQHQLHPGGDDPKHELASSELWAADVGVSGSGEHAGSGRPPRAARVENKLVRFQFLVPGSSFWFWVPNYEPGTRNLGTRNLGT